MKINNEVQLDFDDVLLVPQRSKAASRKDIDLQREFRFYHSNRHWVGMPIMAANMSTTGSFDMAKSLAKQGAITCLHKHYKANDIIKFLKDGHDAYLSKVGSPNVCNYVWISIGMKDTEVERLDYIFEQLPFKPNICIDIANGYTDKFVEYCASIRKKVGIAPIIMAGNVCTPEMVQELILHGGVDIVKVGIGPGSACTTRLKTGVGFPQLSAIMSCSHVAHGLKSDDKRMGLICGDGGCRIPADVCKAFAGNADFVMLGGMLAGADECEGEWEYETIYRMTDGINLDYPMTLADIKKNLLFYGMSSETAQNKHNGGMETYKCSEGRVKKIPYKGPVENILQDIKGGLASCCSYLGATSLKDLPKCANAIRVNRTHFDQSL